MTRGRRERNRRRDVHEVGLFIIETKGATGRWTARSSRSALKGAQDYAWELLTREGGEVRIRQGGRTIASGAGLTPSDL